MTESRKAGGPRPGGPSRPGDKPAGRAGAGTAPGEFGQGLSDLTQKRLGAHLRAMYDTIVQQPVPDRFRDLIMKLDAADGDKV